jgi:hypothetical protein
MKREEFKEEVGNVKNIISRIFAEGESDEVVNLSSILGEEDEDERLSVVSSNEDEELDLSMLGIKKEEPIVKAVSEDNIVNNTTVEEEVEDEPKAVKPKKVVKAPSSESADPFIPNDKLINCVVGSEPINKDGRPVWTFDKVLKAIDWSRLVPISQRDEAIEYAKEVLMDILDRRPVRWSSGRSDALSIKSIVYNFYTDKKLASKINGNIGIALELAGYIKREKRSVLLEWLV